MLFVLSRLISCCRRNVFEKYLRHFAFTEGVSHDSVENAIFMFMEGGEGAWTAVKFV